jgi:hypothetical protein
MPEMKRASETTEKVVSEITSNSPEVKVASGDFVHTVASEELQPKKRKKSVKPSKITDEDVKKAVEESSIETNGAQGIDYWKLSEVLFELGVALTGTSYYQYQEQIAKRVFYAVLRSEIAELSVIISRQAGKSETMALIIDTLCVIMPAFSKFIPEYKQYERGFNIGLFAPQKDQMLTTYDRALSKLKTDNADKVMSDEEINTQLLYEKKLVLSNGSSLTGQIVSKLSKIESKTYHFIIIEEAQEADSLIIEKSIYPMGTATGATKVLVGTTGRERNVYYETIKHNKLTDRRNKLLDYKDQLHFEFDYKAVIQYRRMLYDLDKNVYHLNYERVVAKEVDKGVYRESFQLSYALKWKLEEGMFMTESIWNDLLNKKLNIADIDRITEDDHIVAGIDFGKTRASTVITIGKVLPIEDEYEPNPPKVVLDWLEMRGDDYETQHHAIVDFLLVWGVKVVFIDYTGVGKAIGDRLMAQLTQTMNIIPYTFTPQSKSDMWQNLDADIKAGRIIIPGSRQAKERDEYQSCLEQFLNLKKEWKGSYLVCQKSEGYNDDYPDSMGLMALAGNFAMPAPAEESSENPFYGDVIGDIGYLQQLAY